MFKSKPKVKTNDERRRNGARAFEPGEEGEADMKEMMEFCSQMMEGCSPETFSQMMNGAFIKSTAEKAIKSREDVDT